MEEFKKLWKEFILGTKSLNYQLGKNGRTVAYLRETERFRTRIVEPMDRAWQRLEPFEKATFKERPKW